MKIVNSFNTNPLHKLLSPIKTMIYKYLWRPGYDDWYCIGHITWGVP